MKTLLPFLTFSAILEGLVITVFAIQPRYIAKEQPELKRLACVIINTHVRQDSALFLVQGSGAIISKQGLILTNFHNVRNAESIEVRLFGGRSYLATTVFSDPRKDLALLKITAQGLPFFSIDKTANVRVGEVVYAIGSPKQLAFSVTNGIVGGLNRQIGAIEHPHRIERFIQTNVQLNPGCSGGPLLNQDGCLVGINTAILTTNGRFEGYSFAIPVDLVNNFLEEYVAQKKSTKEINTSSVWVLN